LGVTGAYRRGENLIGSHFNLRKKFESGSRKGGTRIPLLLGPGQVSGRLTKTVSPMGLYQGTWLLGRAGQLAVASSGYYRSRGGRGRSKDVILANTRGGRYIPRL